MALLHVVSVLPGLCMLFYTSHMLLSIFVPIMGRTASNPEVLVAHFAGVAALFAVEELVSLPAP